MPLGSTQGSSKVGRPLQSRVGVDQAARPKSLAPDPDLATEIVTVNCDLDGYFMGSVDGVIRG